MSTFIGQLIGFALIVLIIMRYVAPPVRRLMAAQQETVRNQLEESSVATQRLAAADTHHAQRVADGQAEARHIVEEARTDSVRIAEQLRAQADVEVDRPDVKGLGHLRQGGVDDVIQLCLEIAETICPMRP